MMKIRNAIFLIIAALVFGGLGSYVIFAVDKPPVPTAAEATGAAVAGTEDYAKADIPDLLKAMKMNEPLPKKQAVDFELKTLDGGTVKLSSFKGNTVLLNFFTTW